MVADIFPLFHEIHVAEHGAQALPGVDRDEQIIFPPFCRGKSTRVLGDKILSLRGENRDIDPHPDRAIDDQFRIDIHASGP